MTLEEIRDRIYKNPAVALKLQRNIQDMEYIECMPDNELAEQLLGRIWSELEIFSYEASLIEVAVSRLLKEKHPKEQPDMGGDK